MSGRRIAIGAVAGTIGGPATYAIELVRALTGVSPADEFVVLSDEPAPFAGICDVRVVGMRSAWEQPL